MALSDLLKKTPWVIEEHALEQIYSILTDHHKGIKYNLDEIEASIGKKLANKTRGITMVGSVAVIPMVGVIAPRIDLFSSISGGVSAETLAKDIEEALENKEVDAIVLKIDSPGGTVNGTKQVSDLIYKSRGVKPIYTHVAGTMASGALWIGTASERVSAIDTADIGSIGVVMSHFDYSKADEKAGIKRTFLTAGKYKRLVNSAEPLSKEGEAYMQEILDDYYSLFVTAVATQRGTTETRVLEDMADGKMFVAPKALKNGIIDAIEPIETTIKLAAEAAENRGTGGDIDKKTTVDNQKTGGKEEMNIAELKEKHPDLYQELLSKGKAEASGDLTTQISMLTEENKTLKTHNIEQEGIIVNMKKSIKDLEKKDAIREERETRTTVEHVWDTHLTASSIPNNLFGKVKGSVDHKDHIKDGMFDAADFTDAVKVEVKDWETKLGSLDTSTSVVLGHSFTKNPTIEEENDDSNEDAWMANMLGKAGDTKAVEKLQ